MGRSSSISIFRRNKERSEFDSLIFVGLAGSPIPERWGCDWWENESGGGLGNSLLCCCDWRDEDRGVGGSRRGWLSVARARQAAATAWSFDAPPLVLVLSFDTGYLYAVIRALAFTLVCALSPTNPFALYVSPSFSLVLNTRVTCGGLPVNAKHLPYLLTYTINRIHGNDRTRRATQQTYALAADKCVQPKLNQMTALTWFNGQFVE